MASPSLCDSLKYQARQFCLNTGLHGYRFIVLPKRILLERVIWGIVVALALIAAVTLLMMAWTNFQENPTIVVTDSTHHPIWNYPFPGVTICSYNSISKIRATDFAKNLFRIHSSRTSSISQEEILGDLKLLNKLFAYNAGDTIGPVENLTRLQTLLYDNKLNVYNVMKYLANPCNETVQRCKWKGEEKRCDKLFLLVPTPEGFCCSFNFYGLRNFTFPGAIAKKTPKKPRRVSACGYLTALEVLINTDPDDYLAAKVASIGNKVVIHNPFHIPDWNSQTILVESGVISLIGITPERTYATENIANMEQSKRRCLFSHERELLNNLPNFHNCVAECRLNFTVKLCNCVPFYYHNPNGNYPETRICDLSDIKCLHDNQYITSSSVPGFDILNLKPNHEWGSEKNACGCTDDCEYTQYLAEASSGALTRKYSNNQLNLYGGVVLKHQSVVRVYFNDLVATKNRRDVTFSWHTLLAYYGGILGLFIGFSFVSAVELVYFFTVRLISDVNDKNDHKISEKRPKMISVQPPPQYQDSLLTITDKFTLRRRNSSNSN